MDTLGPSPEEMGIIKKPDDSKLPDKDQLKGKLDEMVSRSYRRHQSMTERDMTGAGNSGRETVRTLDRESRREGERAFCDDSGFVRTGDRIVIKHVLKQNVKFLPGSAAEAAMEKFHDGVFSLLGENPHDYVDDPQFPRSSRISTDSNGREIVELRLIRKSK